MAKPKAKNKDRATDADVTVLLDDKWLNQAEHWLDELTQGAERTFGRKPAITEFQELLTTVLGGGPVDRWFRDGDATAIRSVVFKTEPRAATAAKPQVGDILIIPLEQRDSAFARVIHLRKGWGAIVEVFRRTSRDPGSYEAAVSSGRLFHPVCINDVECIESGRWKIVASDPHYRPSAEDKKLEFASPLGGKWAARRLLDETRPPRPLAQSEIHSVEWEANKPCEVVEERIREALGAR